MVQQSSTAPNAVMTTNWPMMVNVSQKIVSLGTTNSMRRMPDWVLIDVMTTVSATEPEDALPINTAPNVSTWSIFTPVSMT